MSYLPGWCRGCGHGDLDCHCPIEREHQYACERCDIGLDAGDEGILIDATLAFCAACRACPVCHEAVGKSPEIYGEIYYCSDWCARRARSPRRDGDEELAARADYERSRRRDDALEGLS